MLFSGVLGWLIRVPLCGGVEFPGGGFSHAQGQRYACPAVTEPGAAHTLGCWPEKVDLPGEIMKRIALALATAALSVALPVKANEELAKKHACFACHAVDKKLVGPAYKEVAAKYRSDKGAEAKLVDKVKKGGSGVWGQVAMSPNPAVPDADVRALVQWVLSQK